MKGKNKHASRRGKKHPNNAQTVSLAVHSELLATNQVDTNYIQVNIAPQVAAFQTAVAMAGFYQSYSVQRVRWKIIYQKPANVLLANGAHYSIPRYYKVDLVNNQIPQAEAAQYLKYQKVSVGLMNGVLSGAFTPYSSVVGQQDRAYKQKQQITTNNLDLYNYGCSILIKKDVVPAMNQLYAVTVIVSATIKFHHFDGIAAVARYSKLFKSIKAVAQNNNASKDVETLLQTQKTDDQKRYSLLQIQLMLLKGGIQPNPGPEVIGIQQGQPL